MPKLGKRKSLASRHARRKKRFAPKKKGTKEIRRIARMEIDRNVETKQSLQTSVDGTEVLHNNFVTLNSTLLQTTPGVTDPNTNAISNRVGDEIMLKGVSIKMMIELNERYSDVTCRLLVVKCAKGDAPTRITLFNNLTGNKMIDTINTERYTIIARQTFKIKAPNTGTLGSSPGGQYLGGGLNHADDVNVVLSRATKIVKMWIPGKKFSRTGKIIYENATSQVKFFDYHVLLYAYSNYSTLQDMFFVARVNDYIQQIYFKDA